MTNTMKAFITDLQNLQNAEKAQSAMWFFKCHEGGYGEGDKFWGITVPQQRSVCKKYHKLLNINELSELLRHEIHELRLSALMIMVMQYKKCKDELARKAIVDVYLASLQYINNWDLVDSSAHYILGEWLLDKDWSCLKDMAMADHLWTQRIAIIATHAFIRKGIFEPTFCLADILLNHKHDLIHKAVGWMLREAGAVDYQAEYNFLTKRYKNMPRTMLRYAIEKFDEAIRQKFLKSEI